MSVPERAGRRGRPGSDYCAVASQDNSVICVSDAMPSPINSEEDSVFTDADEELGRHLAGGSGRTTRRVSVPERVQGFERPPASSAVSQKRRRVSSHGHGHPPSAGLDDLALTQIKGLIEAGNTTVIQKLERLEARLASFENRLDKIEHDGFETASKTDRLQEDLQQLRLENNILREQLSSIDVNNRQDSLILKCEDFGPRMLNEDIEDKTVRLLNSKFEWLQVSRGDFQVVHRLQANNTVICKFLRRSIRDQIYDSRFIQNTRGAGNRLFITESLSAPNRELMNMLLTAKREGRIYTCFTRRGCPFFKERFDSNSRRVTSVEQIKPILDAPLPRPQARPGPRSADRRGERGGGRAGGGRGGRGMGGRGGSVGGRGEGGAGTCQGGDEPGGVRSGGGRGGAGGDWSGGGASREAVQPVGAAVCDVGSCRDLGAAPSALCGAAVVGGVPGGTQTAAAAAPAAGLSAPGPAAPGPAESLTSHPLSSAPEPGTVPAGPGGGPAEVGDNVLPVGADAGSVSICD